MWDTVSALSFPQDWSIVVEKFFALADRLSDYVFPHRFYNYRLNDSIVSAGELFRVSVLFKDLFSQRDGEDSCECQAVIALNTGCGTVNS
ncbi:MAG: hypothetical protein ACU833_01250 [Gammaproteobacteria bacterium]